MNYLLIDGRPGNPYDNELLEMAKHHAFALFILYLKYHLSLGHAPRVLEFTPKTMDDPFQLYFREGRSKITH